MIRLFPYLTVLAAVVLSGVVQGVWTNRWNRAGKLQAAVAKLQEVPRTLGDWDGKDHELTAREVAIAGIDGYVLRKYVNRRTGSVVTIYLACGRPGPVAVHTPDECYPGAGFAQAGTATRYAPPGTPAAEFKVQQFRRQNPAAPSELRIFHTFGQAGAWTTPEHPRLAFARSSVLYKLYVVREMASASEPPEKDPATDLIKVLMPELQRALFAAS
jgi:hypothetical protein